MNLFLTDLKMETTLIIIDKYFNSKFSMKTSFYKELLVEIPFF